MKKTVIRKHSKSKWRWIGISVVAIFAISLSVFLYENTIVREHVSQGYLFLTNWVNQHKNHVKVDTKKIKKMAAKEPEEPSIHFEFYHALPSMQMNVAQINNAAQGNDVPISKVSDKNEPMHYILQLGVFRQPSTAEAYRNSFAQRGLAVNIVKVNGNTETYRVQSGPFQNLDQAKLTQKQFEKRGIEGLLRKINEREK